jgi:lipopolysaccharide export system permease protein
MLYDIRIYDHTLKHGNTTVTYADSGTMKLTEDERYLVMTLYSGRSYDELDPEKQNRRDYTYPQRRDKFQEQVLTIEMKGFELNRTDESLFRGNYNMMSLEQLRHVQDSIIIDINEINNGLTTTLNRTTYLNYRRASARNKQIPSDTLAPTLLVLNGDSLFNVMSQNHKLNVISQAITQARSSLNYVTTSYVNSDSKIRRLRRYQIEIQRKFTLSFACFIFFFIGAPLGAIIRKGGLGMPTVISVLFFLVYYVISLSGEKFVRESMVSPFQGMWISAAVLLPMGIFLTYKAATDAAIMSMETYSNIIRKINRFFRYHLLRLKFS